MTTRRNPFFARKKRPPGPSRPLNRRSVPFASASNPDFQRKIRPAPSGVARSSRREPPAPTGASDVQQEIGFSPRLGLVFDGGSSGRLDATSPAPTGGAMASDPITVLHLSDIQFGRHHRFESDDESFGTLYQRLEGDLRGLAEGHGLQPDLVVVTGDLAEWGRPKEFEEARRFPRVSRELSRPVSRPSRRDTGQPRRQPGSVRGLLQELQRPGPEA